MPAGDGTGPMGMGPRTGRGAGYCAGYSAPGWANPMPGRGLQLGRGRDGGGRGRRHQYWFYATGVPGWARTASRRRQAGDRRPSSSDSRLNG